MILLKRKPLVTDNEKNQLKNLVRKTFLAALQSGDETICVIERHDLILISYREEEYIDSSIYHKSALRVLLSGKIIFTEEPIFTERRYYYKKDDALLYFDKKQLKHFSAKNTEAFYYVCESVRNFEAEF
ncbi:hypothetical protein [Planococcus sp. YIM B11945]|uniref:hypothetical protein n=1 Tax=Planococcus sp. YIM B11945 TaxID=3435410 RepID=UPI003D7CC65F